MEKAIKISQFQDVFNPAPLSTKKDIEDFYYQTSFARTGDEYSDFVRMLSIQIEDSKDTCLHKIFIGHAGSGKTTELFRLREYLEEKKFATGFGRCDLDLDGGDIEYIDVMFLILDILVGMCQKYDIKLREQTVNNIYEYWNTEVESIDNITNSSETNIEGNAEASANFLTLIKVFSKIKGILKNSTESRMTLRKKVEPKVSELMFQIKDLITYVQEELKKQGLRDIPVIILDGLDKIPINQARQIFKENGARFADLPIHLIITFPIALTYDASYQLIQSWFPNPEKLPMIKIQKWNKDHYEEGYMEGINTLKTMVGLRADIELFEENVLETLILNTGGYIRDLFACISKAAARARVRSAETVCMKDAEYALGVLEADLNGRYKEKFNDMLKRIYHGEKYFSASEEITELLQLGVVLEYNGERWCDLHPLVKKWLKEHNRV